MTYLHGEYRFLSAADHLFLFVGPLTCGLLKSTVPWPKLVEGSGARPSAEHSNLVDLFVPKVGSKKTDEGN